MTTSVATGIHGVCYYNLVYKTHQFIVLLSDLQAVFIY